MKSVLISACFAMIASLAIAKNSNAEIVVHIGGRTHGDLAAQHRYSHHHHGLANRGYYGNGYLDSHAFPYAHPSASCFPYARLHYFYEWRRPYYGFRAHSGAYGFGY